MADTWFVSNVVLEVVIALLVIIGNSLFLVTLAKNRHLQTVTNFLIASLTIADLSVGLIGVPSVIATLFGLPHNLYGCLTLNCFIIILTQVSIFSLLAVAIERFIAIKYPFFYHEHYTLKVAVIVSIINWILGIFVGLVPMFWNLGWNNLNVCNYVLVIDFNYKVYFNYFAFIITPLLIMFFIYIAIFMVVKKQARVIQNLQVAGQGTDQESALKKEMRAARKFALVIGLFALCWLPLETMNAITLWTGKTCLPCVFIAVWLSHLNSALNPLLYAYGSSAVRKAMLTTLCCGSNQVEDMESSIDTVSAELK